ncbi:uncharacterized protein LOC126669406 [Mercurialis annua]|uniref:uncharacterized protein LOC126669406 n=1 Tax=Mercurialis annua TaxID=3986 RepID=UPI0021600C79|nr:uncharacterized protein LOC126669406 [Mercurialis annua]
MARGPFCNDANLDTSGGGGGGGGGGYTKLSRREFTSSSSSPPPPSNLRCIYMKPITEDVFFGKDDGRDMKEITGEDYILECYRREKALKSFKKKKKSRFCFASCFDFLKVLFSTKF